MSIKSTHAVTRQFALDAIKMKLEQTTDDQLENILEEIIHNGFYNFVIVPEQDLEKLKNSEFSRILDDLENLPEYNDAY